MIETWIQKYLARQYSNPRLIPIQGGASGAGLFAFQSDELEQAILKVEIHREDLGSLEKEILLLQWLHPQILVPVVHHFSSVNHESQKQFDVFLMSTLNGKNLKVWRHEICRHEVAKVYGEALRALHDIPYTHCPVVANLEARLNEVRNLIDSDLINTDGFEEQFKQRALEDLYRELIETMPKNTDLVCAHGDYCLDNLLAESRDGKSLIFSGFIDMGRGGVQDRYQDLALAIRSVRKHLGKEFETTFLKSYGLVEELDEQKLRYYILLDEFF